MDADITTRLRRWTHAVDAAPASDLMDEAADEITRLRLTDAEREVIQWAANAMRPECRAILRGLLERTK